MLVEIEAKILLIKTYTKQTIYYMNGLGKIADLPQVGLNFLLLPVLSITLAYYTCKLYLVSLI